ncbi:MAG: 1-acyl-sn-glycerol-3-phosphate acyltransferase [Rhodothermales bacterium]|nr:1-acyl-sn-glycerol-3-phosphate acyltransferase [Rhodothermales bacterium]MBO6778642.1 1-acyl-sn-glycerol-3-phosphate acyltransferase [Rhodothermales bacterium]
MLRLFFREVVIEGAENIPADRGGLFVAAHPNGLIDPALILVGCPRHVVFGARHGLFDWPVLGPLMRRMGAVPIYRAMDESTLTKAEKLELNRKSLEGLAGALVNGSFSALFPEGNSHDLPHLIPVKTGAARLYYQARAQVAVGQPAPAIIPVGLHYDRKNIFRSRVLVVFHPPLDLPADLDCVPDPARLRSAVKNLTERIAEKLTEVVGSTDDWRLHHLMHRAGKLVRAEMGWRRGKRHEKPDLTEKQLAYQRIWAGYQARAETHAEELAGFRSRLSAYDRYLGLLGLRDHELTDLPKLASPWLLTLFVGQVVLVYFLFPPLLVLGFLINIGPYYLLRRVSRRFSAKRKDEATVKILGGAVLFPLAWIVVALGAWFAHEELRSLFPGMPDVWAAVVLVTLFVSVFGGYLALIYAELSRQTFRAMRVRATRRRRQALLDKLISERSFLCNELLQLGEGLELPGERLPDGRLQPAS